MLVNFQLAFPNMSKHVFQEEEENYCIVRNTCARNRFSVLSTISVVFTFVVKRKALAWQLSEYTF